MKEQYNALKQELMNDINKAPKKDWKIVGCIWLLILYTFFSGIGNKAQAYEDYSTSLPDYPHYCDNPGKSSIFGNEECKNPTPSVNADSRVENQNSKCYGDPIGCEWEDYSSEIGKPLEFGEILKNDMVELVGNYNTYQRNWINFAWKISHDKEFLYMLKAENGLLNHDRRSQYVSNGVQEPSYGFCQIHRGYHPRIVNNLKFKDPAWQLGQCLKLWKGGTIFYGAERIKKNPAYRAKIESHFKFE